jgi:hypothetical protein
MSKYREMKGSNGDSGLMPECAAGMCCGNLSWTWTSQFFNLRRVRCRKVRWINKLKRIFRVYHMPKKPEESTRFPD